ncbi:MAG: hypothetical protein WC737_05735 [Parcubacteria group bacterium]|jgi:hypothetical protein
MTTIADKLLKYLKDYADKRVKAFYYGDPLVIPISNMPAVIIENKSATVSQGATGLDKISVVFSIKLVMSKKDEIGKTPDEVVLQRTMADIIMGRTADNDYEPTSIMGVLRTYFTLGDSIQDQNETIEFFISERGEVIAEEAEITITINDFVNVASRQ